MCKGAKPKRCDIFYAKLEGKGSQQKGIKPVLIYSNNTNNAFAPTMNVFPLTSKLKDLLVHVLIEGYGLSEPSMVLVEQITTINKDQLKGYIGTISDLDMARVERASDIQFGRKSYKQAPVDNPFGVA